MQYIHNIILFFFFISLLPLSAQEDLEALLDEEMADHTEYAIGTFFSSRIIYSHSVEKMPKKGLDFRIAHRFGLLNSGFNEFWGIDESSSYLSLEYGITDWLMVGVGRATYHKTCNGFIKPVILRQSSGNKNVPFTLTLHSAMAVNSTIYDDKERNKDFVSRIDYTHQLLIGRKLGPKLSLQLTPTFVHRNLVRTPEENNDLYAMGFGGRYKIMRRVAFSFEYFYVHGNKDLNTMTYYDPIAVGVDIQAGGHVFQLHVTNALPMTENAFIGETTEDFFKGDIRFGFNISQVFSLGKE